MNNTAVVASREIAAYLASPMTYILAGVFLFFSGTFFSTYLSKTDYSDTSLLGFIEVARILILLFAALMTMGLIAEERKLGTWELILTAPIREYELVLGKFLAGVGVLCGMLFLTVYFPLLLFMFGDPDIGPMATSYLGLFLLGSAAMAVGLFASSLTSSQVVAAVLSGGLLFALWFLIIVDTFLPGSAGELFAAFSLATHFSSFVRGVIDVSAVVYYLSVTALFLYLATTTIENTRWR